MDAISLAQLFNMYRLLISPQGEVSRQLIGRVHHDGIEPEVLADYFGLLSPLSDPTRAGRTWKSLTNHAYFEAVPLDQIHGGFRPDLVPEDKSTGEDPNGSEPEQLTPPSKFLYQHQDMADPMPLEIQDGVARLDGNEMGPEQFNRVLENLRNGVASIRYNFGEASIPVLKMEPVFSELMKIEPHLQEALGHLQNATDAGHLDPKVLEILRRELFTDPMVPEMGNKKARADFLSRPREGIHIHMDGNNFKSINDTLGHAAGDDAIKAMGNAVVAAKNEVAGADKAKSWRSEGIPDDVFREGGDEMSVFMPTYEHAARFARSLRDKLAAIPPIGGTHQLSMSLGLGHNPESAEQALLQAKASKKAAGYQPGRAKTHVHSLVPGFEGEVPVEPSVPHIALPPKDARPGSSQGGSEAKTPAPKTGVPPGESALQP